MNEQVLPYGDSKFYWNAHNLVMTAAKTGKTDEGYCIYSIHKHGE